jgi:hypothetical protein
MFRGNIPFPSSGWELKTSKKPAVVTVSAHFPLGKELRAKRPGFDSWQCKTIPFSKAFTKATHNFVVLSSRMVELRRGADKSLAFLIFLFAAQQK